MSTVLVVGGGIIGASVAFRAAQAGAKVTLLDAGELGQGASTVGYGMTFASNKNDHAYYQFNVAGMGEHIRLKHELGGAPWLHQVGSIQWERETSARDYVGNSDPIKERTARLRGWGYKAEVLPISELRSLEPDVVAPSDVEEFVYYADEGYIDPVLYVGSLVGLARDLGTTVRTQCAVTQFICKGDVVKGVETSSGEKFFADTVVCCAGRWTDELANLAGIELPMAPWIGLTLISTPTAARLNSVVRDEGFATIRPDGAGRIMMHHNDFDEMVQPDNPNDPSPEVKSALLNRAAEMLPQLRGARIETSRITIRPVPGGDHNSVIGPVSQVGGLYFVVSHSAINLAPLLGRLAASEVVSGRQESRLAPFRPDRLTRAIER